MSPTFDQSWRDWIRLNISRGCEIQGILAILLERGFDEATARAEIESVSAHNKMQAPPAVTAGARSAVPITSSQAPLFANARRLANNKLELHLLEDFVTDSEAQQLSAEGGRYHAGAHAFITEGVHLSALDRRMQQFLGVAADYCDSADVHHSADLLELGRFNKYQLRQASYGFAVITHCGVGARLQCASLDLNIELKVGDAFIWRLMPGAYGNRFKSDATELPRLLGELSAVYKTYRTAARGNGAPPFFCKSKNENLPHFSRDGFWRTTIPEALFADIREFYQSERTSVDQEVVPGGYVHQLGAKSGGSQIKQLPSELRRRIHDSVKPAMENWSNTALEPSTVYGIRIYRRDAVLKPHRDRVETHVFGAILNVAQTVDEDWPLLIEDHFYRPHTILLKPGDMLFYEGAKLTHGRPTPFKGEAFANIFCHFSPVGHMTGAND